MSEVVEMKIARDLLAFIEKSPSCFHVVENIKNKLVQAGFNELSEKQDWELALGGKYYVTRNDSSIIAFQIPEEDKLEKSSKIKGFHMVASHSDSPTFKIKEHADTASEKQYLRLNTEKYGGMIMSTWLDRPLSVAGRIAISVNGELQTRLVNIDQDLCVIPNLAIHMNRDMNKGVEYNPQIDMLPLYSGYEEEGTGKFMDLIAASAGVDKEEILGHDLYLYVRESGRVLGANAEYILSPKLDDLQCAYASMEAFLQAKVGNYIPLCAVFDNEEVGSGTMQGADSTFLQDVMYRICDCLAKEEQKNSGVYLKQLVADSFLISADNAHAVHPNHPEKADPTNRPYLNGGIVIKYHGGQKYTTDAVSGAKMKELCNLAGVPFQTYTNRSDVAGGSTLGNISTAHVSVKSVDIGLPQLAMHSAVETAGSMDTAYAIKALQLFFEE